MDSFKTEIGQCVITEEELRLERGIKSFFRRKYETDPRPFYLISTGVLSLVGLLYAFPNAYPGSFRQQIGGLAFLVGIIVASVVILIYSASVLKMWLAQKTDEFPENTSNEGVIPLDSIDSVEITEYRSRPVVYIHFYENNDRLTRVVFFQQNADDEIETARTVFASRGLLNRA